MESPLENSISLGLSTSITAPVIVITWHLPTSFEQDGNQVTKQARSSKVAGFTIITLCHSGLPVLLAQVLKLYLLHF